MKPAGPVAVYRHFDAAGALLYIGQSNSPSTRPEQICRGGSTWCYEVAKITVEWWPDRQQAMAAEALAISRENPRHNVIHSKDRRQRLPNRGGQVVRHWLSENGMTDRDLAERLKRPVGWLRKVLNDEIHPNWKSADQITEITGISRLVFFRGKSFPRYAKENEIARARAQLEAAGAA